MEEKYIVAAGYICHGLMINQIEDRKFAFESCKNYIETLYGCSISQKEFDNILHLLKRGLAITQITNTHILQTSSLAKPAKSHKEISAIG